MRALWIVSVVAFAGCEKASPTTPAPVVVAKKDADAAPPAPPDKKPPVEKKEPPKKEPELRLKLADARVKILNLDKAGVKKLLGPPDDTVMDTFGGVNTVVWVYRNQRVVWNEDAEKYYPLLTVAFYQKVDGSDPGKAVEVKVP